MNLLDFLEARLDTRTSFWERKDKVNKLCILLDRLQGHLKYAWEHRSSVLDGLDVRVDPSPGFSDYGERCRAIDPNCEIREITVYFCVDDFGDKWRPRKSVQVVLPVEVAEKLLVLGVP